MYYGFTPNKGAATISHQNRKDDIEMRYVNPKTLRNKKKIMQPYC